VTLIGGFNSWNLYVPVDKKIPYFILKDYHHKILIKIKEPKYFYHKKNLDQQEKERLIVFLNNKFPLFDNTNWQVILAQWSMNNPEYEINQKTEMPNYLNL